MLELAVDLVARTSQAPRSAQSSTTRSSTAARHRRAGRVVRRVDVDELRVGPQRPLERVEVVGPAVRGEATPLRHARRRPSGRPGAPTRSTASRRRRGRPARGARGRRGRSPPRPRPDDDDVVRLGRLVDRRDRRPQLGRAGRLRVAEAQREQPLVGLGLEREQVGDGDRLGVARREHVRRRELVDGVVAARSGTARSSRAPTLRRRRAVLAVRRRRARRRGEAGRRGARRRLRGRWRSRSRRRGSRRRAPAAVSAWVGSAAARREDVGRLVRGERREQGQSERAADLLRGVEEARREPGVVDRERRSSRSASPARTSGPCRST